MEFDGLKINTPAKAEKKEESAPEAPKPKRQMVVDDHEFNDAEGKELLKKVKSIREADEDNTIYGVYNNSDKGFLTKVNDFLIDHSRVTLKDRSYFFHMLAVMIDAGVPLVEAVKSLASRTENKRFKRILNTIAHNCEGGMNLADAMTRFDDVFDESEIGIVRSGEATGRLDQMLFKLSNNLDRRNDLNTKLWGAAVYPITVLVVLMLVLVAMLVWVFPSLLRLLTEGGLSQDALPLPTRALIWSQNLVVDWWWLGVILILVGYGLFVMYRSSDYGRVRWDYVKLKLPIAGTLMRKVYVLRFVGMLGILIDAGIPVIQSLQITARSMTNKVYTLKIKEVISAVAKGGKISHNLRDTRFLFPPEVVQMISVGESSASLGKISAKVSGQYQKEVDNTLKKLTSVFEPVMILVVGVLVALLALAVMSPIFNLSTLVS